MKKKTFVRILKGFYMGISTGYLISLIVSYIFGDGTYSIPCTPALVAAMGNEINALMLATFLYGVIGAGTAAGLVVWEIDRWNLATQTGAYFLIISLVNLPIAYVMNWMEHSMVGFLYYFGTFVFYFVIIWIIKYLMWKSSVKKMNAKLRKMNEDKKQSP